MNRYLLLIITFLLLSVFCFGQITFQKAIGRSGIESVSSIQQTFDGGYIMAGSTDALTAGSTDAFIIKTNSLGDTLWTKTYGNILEDGASSIQQTSDSEYIVVGTTINTTSGIKYSFLIRLNYFGDTIWTKVFDGVVSYVEQTFDGGYILAGGSSSSATSSDAYLIKTNSSGDTLWTKKYGGATTYDCATSVKQTTDSGFIFCGWSDGILAYLVKVNSVGDTVWTKSYGNYQNPHQLAMFDVDQTIDGGFIAIGQSDNFGAGSWDCHVIKTDSNGDTLWTRTYGGANPDYGLSIRQTPDGGYIMVGRTNNFGFGNTDIYLLKIDFLGDLQWAKSYGGAGFDSGRKIELTSDGGFIIAGTTTSFGAGNTDIYIIKTDSNGNSGCSETTANAIVTMPAYDAINFTTIISSPGISVSTFAPHIGGGGEINDLCLNTGIESLFETGIIIYPNPTTNAFTINNIAPKENSLVQIINVLGEVVFMENHFGKNECKVDANFAKGIYFVSIINSGVNIVRKLIVE